MKCYNIAFVGLGSIGRRHLNDVCTCLESRGCACSTDVYDVLQPDDFPEEVRTRVDRILSYSAPIPAGLVYDVVFITNPTSMHLEALHKFADHAKAFFVEKPVFDSTDVDPGVLEELKGKICYVACPIRYSSAVMYVRENVDYGRALAVRAISSSYLPDWRPGRDYRRCYSAHREQGGGVGIDLVHEWDYLTSLWGIPEKCLSIRDKVSDLEIDSDDVAIYVAKAGGTTIELHLDYFGRKEIRAMDIFMPDDTIRCDIVEGRVEYLKSGRVVNLESGRKGFYQREIAHFFDIVEGKAENDSTVGHGLAVLKLATGNS